MVTSELSDYENSVSDSFISICTWSRHERSGVLLLHLCRYRAPFLGEVDIFDAVESESMC